MQSKNIIANKKKCHETGSLTLPKGIIKKPLRAAADDVTVLHYIAKEQLF